MNLFCKCHKSAMIAMLTVLCIAHVSCVSMRQSEVDGSGMPSRQRTPGAVSRNNGNHNSGWARVNPNDNYPNDDHDNDAKDNNISSIPANNDQWKKLDLQLTRNDNQALYSEIKSWLGTPYAGGGHTKQVGTDCSGFVMEIYLTVYKKALERRGSLMYTNNCQPIDKSQLREGDLVFFHDGSGSRISHVGIYLKDNKFAHASSSRGVVIDDLNANYYVKHYYASGRVK